MEYCQICLIFKAYRKQKFWKNIRLHRLSPDIVFVIFQLWITVENAKNIMRSKKINVEDKMKFKDSIIIHYFIQKQVSALIFTVEVKYAWVYTLNIKCALPSGMLKFKNSPICDRIIPCRSIGNREAIPPYPISSNEVQLQRQNSPPPPLKTTYKGKTPTVPNMKS